MLPRHDRALLGAHRYWSLGAAVVALTALVLTYAVHLAPPAPVGTAACNGLPPFRVSVPEAGTLPATPAAGPNPARTVTPAAGTPISSATPLPATPWPAPLGPLRRLIRADDLPADHAIVIANAAEPLLLLVIPAPCGVPDSPRRTPSPCLKLLPPGAQLCVSGVAGNGRLGAEPDAPALAFQAGKVTITDTDGNQRAAADQSFFRYDDLPRGIQLICPRLPVLEPIGSNARRLVALCSNHGEQGWAVSGQVTDGGGAAPDSVGLAIDAPDGSRTSVVGNLAVGAIVVRDLPERTR